MRKYGIYSLELLITQDWSQLEMTITCSSTVKLMVLAVLDLFAIVKSKVGLITNEPLYFRWEFALVVAHSQFICT